MQLPKIPNGIACWFGSHVPHPLLCVDDDLELDKRGVSVFGVAVQTKTLYIPVCLDWFYYEGSGAGDQWATEQKGALNSLSGVLVLFLFPGT
jgi:hypothetical protein